MKPTLYIFSGAPRPWRVTLALVFKNIRPDIKILDYAKGEHRTAEFAKVNPRGTLPVLTHGETRLRDSIAILAWLDRAYPERPLFGDTAEESAQIWQVTMECADYLRDANYKLLSLVFSSRGKEIKDESAEAKALISGAKLAHAECQFLENLLSDNRLFLCGDRPTAADAIAFPEVRLIQRGIDIQSDLMGRVGFTDLADRYPKTAAWLTRLNTMPEVAATLPPHWDETPVAA